MHRKVDNPSSLEISQHMESDTVKYMANHMDTHMDTDMVEKKGKHKPPSRVRYEQAHPMIGVRLTRTMKDILDKRKSEENKSYAQIIREILMGEVCRVELESRLKEIEKENEDLHNEINKLHKENTELQEKEKLLLKENAEMKDRVAGLSMENAELQKEIENVVRVRDRLEQQNEAMRKEIDRVIMDRETLAKESTAREKELQRRIEGLEMQIEKLRRVEWFTVKCAICGETIELRSDDPSVWKDVRKVLDEAFSRTTHKNCIKIVKKKRRR